MRQRRAIAVAQTCAVPGDVAANMHEHLRLLELAAGHDAELVLFPELSLTGYEIKRGQELAFSENDARLAPLVAAASSWSTIAVAGAPIRIGAQLHIGAFVVHPDGTISVYTKQRLGAFSERARVDGAIPPAEATVFSRGERNPLIEAGAVRAAIAICADIGDPTHVQRAQERGANSYLASMFVIPSAFDAEADRLRGYALEHRMAVAIANFGAATGGLAAAGRSSIWSDNGDLVVQLPATGSGIAVAIQTETGWHAHTTLSSEI